MMKELQKGVFADILLLILSLVWVGWLCTDYFSKQLLYAIALDKFLYGAFFVKVLLLIAMNVGVFLWGKSRSRYWMVSGWWVVLQSIILVWLANQAVYEVAIEPLNQGKTRFENHPFEPLLHFLEGISVPALFLVVAFATGDLLLHLLGLHFRKQTGTIIRLGTGFGVWMTLLFFLGIGDILFPVVLFPLGLAFVGLRYKSVIQWVNALIVRPHDKYAQKLNPGGVILFLLLTLMVLVNLMRVQTPFPTGSDALNYYVNLARLIGNENGLVHGFQPHNYSLITALGYLVGNGTPSSLVFSSLGGILSLVVLYRIGRSVLKIGPNTLLLTLVVIYLTPIMVVQSIAELKIDLGLLFMSLTTLLLFLSFIRNPPELYKSRLLMLVLIGISCGWLMGIKLTSLFLVFALLAGLWYVHTGLIGFAAIGFFAFGISFIAGMDQVYEIDVAHLSRPMVLAGCLLAGGIAAGVIFVLQRGKLLTLLRESAIIGFFLVLTFSPWMVKNYLETKKLDPKSILMGDYPGKKLFLTDMKKKMRDAEK
jgi:hypothetical protein